MDRNIRLPEENEFLETNRFYLAEFGLAQYAETGSLGAVLIDCREAINSYPLSYLPEATMQEFSLLDGESPVGSLVRNVMDRLDPEAQIVAIFLYENDASLYLLNVDDLMANP
jgi:hypothetical protein